jgi:hypothetical protein
MVRRYTRALGEKTTISSRKTTHNRGLFRRHPDLLRTMLYIGSTPSV